MSPKVISRVLDQGLLEGEESYVVKYQVAVLPVRFLFPKEGERGLGVARAG